MMKAHTQRYKSSTSGRRWGVDAHRAQSAVSGSQYEPSSVWHSGMRVHMTERICISPTKVTRSENQPTRKPIMDRSSGLAAYARRTCMQ